MSKTSIKYLIEGGILLLLLIGTVSFVEKTEPTIVCKKIGVEIKKNERNNLITEEEIYSELNKDERKIRGYPLNQINTRALETEFRKLPQVKTVEAYKQIDSSLHIEVYQREPILRVMDENDKDIFIDEEGEVIPVMHQHPSHVLLANGYVDAGLAEQTIHNILKIDSSSMNRNIEKIQQIHAIASFIHTNDFWRKQVEQIYVDANGEFEIIPRVGAHIIILGEFEDFKWKFRKLKSFYKNGLNHVGWNKYRKINLKYSNQVICTKR